MATHQSKYSARAIRNKNEADTIARARGGKCLSGPRRVHDKWKWWCGDPDHSAWSSTLATVKGTRRKKGSWCPTCSGNARVTRQEMEKHAARFGGKLIKMARQTVENSTWWCKHHKRFERPYNNMKWMGTFCPQCGVSLGERKCKAAFEQIFKRKFVKKRFREMKGIGGKSLELDLYNAELKLAVEHQGAHHYIRKKFYGEERFEHVQEHDRRKRQFCEANGITLIEIRQVGEVTKDNDLKDVIREKLEEKSFPLPAGFEAIEIDLNVAALPTLREEKWEQLKAELAKRGWRLLSKKYLGVLSDHDYICASGHLVRKPPTYVFSGYGCEECQKTPIVLEDYRTFPSMPAAANALRVSVSAVWRAVKKHGRVAGLRAAAVDAETYARCQCDKLAVTEVFRALPRGPQLGDCNKKPVLLGDGRVFASAADAGRELGVDPEVALSACKRPKGKIRGLRIARISMSLAEKIRHDPSLADAFWSERPEYRRRWKKRRSVVTSKNEVFDDVFEASTKLGLKQHSIYDAARRGSCLAGRFFRLTERKDGPQPPGLSLSE